MHCSSGEKKELGRAKGLEPWCICTKIGGVDQTVTNRMVPGVWWPIYEEGASVWWLMVRVFFYCCAAMLYVETLARIAHEWLSACVPMVLSTRAREASPSTSPSPTSIYNYSFSTQYDSYFFKSRLS